MHNFTHGYPTLERLSHCIYFTKCYWECIVQLSWWCQNMWQQLLLFHTTFLFSSFFFFTALEAPCCLIVHSHALTNRASRSVSRLENLFALFAPVIMPAFAPWARLILKILRTDFLIGYCMFSQTHTHDLMNALIGVSSVHQEHRARGTDASPGS